MGGNFARHLKYLLQVVCIWSLLGFVQDRPRERFPRAQLDPLLEGVLLGGGSRAVLQRQAREGDNVLSNPAFLSVFLEGTPDPGALRSLGVRVGAVVGSLRSVRVPPDALGALATLPGVERLTLAHGMKRQLEVSVGAVDADTLRTRIGDEWTGWTGAGVLIGIVDSGLDLTHEDFRHPGGGTRVRFYWDQTDTLGPPPLSAVGDPLYGTEWTASQIDQGVSRAGDREGHGTAVAGAAAGDGSASNIPDRKYTYTGMAPNADLVVVDLDPFLETGVLDAVQYVFTRAEDLGMPAVVNLSLGTQFGPHDGTTPLERGIDALVGPGRLVVTSAGNEGNDAMHAELHVPAGASDTAVVVVPSYSSTLDYESFFVDAWYRTPDSLAVTVVTPKGKSFGPVVMGEILDNVLTGEGTLFLGQGTPDPATGNVEVGMDVSNFDPDPGPGPTPPSPAEGEWHIICTNLSSGGTGEVDLWIPLWYLPVNGLGPHWTTGLDPTEEVSSPGTASGVLTVGSFNSKGHWLTPSDTLRTTTQDSTYGAPSYFTSRGPTRDDRPKPEVIAPGFVITTSLSDEIDAGNIGQYALSITGNPDGQHFTLVGTSLSAPHLSGALALWMERDPGLTPETARIALEASSVADAATGPVWNPAAGFGRLDVAALLGGVVPVLEGWVSLGTDGSGHPRITWGEGEESIRAFRVERALGDGPWVRMATVGAGEERAWTDPDPRGPARYRVQALRADGSVVAWGDVRWTGGLPPRPWLGNPTPNPFASRTRVEVTLAAGTSPAVQAVVLDARGRVVRRLEPRADPGEERLWVDWNGRDDRGIRAAAGVYWFLVHRGAESRSVKVVLTP